MFPRKIEEEDIINESIKYNGVFIAACGFTGSDYYEKVKTEVSDDDAAVLMGFWIIGTPRTFLSPCQTIPP